MDAYIYGWVEIFDAENIMWDGVIKASNLMYADNYVFSTLFGTHNTLFGVQKEPDEISMVPVAARRGLPEDACWEVRKELSHPKMSAFTWITWQELKSVQWKYEPHAWWLVLFKMMAELAEKWGDDWVRLTVGFRFNPE